MESLSDATFPVVFTSSVETSLNLPGFWLICPSRMLWVVVTPSTRLCSSASMHCVMVLKTISFAWGAFNGTKVSEPEPLVTQIFLPLRSATFLMEVLFLFTMVPIGLIR